MNLGHHNNAEVTETDFPKKDLSVNLEKHILGVFFLFFCPYVCQVSVPSQYGFLKYHLRNILTIILILPKTARLEKSDSGCMVGTKPFYLRLSFFLHFFLFTLCQ